MHHHLHLGWTAVQTTYMSIFYCMEPLQPSLAGHIFTAICPTAVAQAHADSKIILDDKYTMYHYLHLEWTAVQTTYMSLFYCMEPLQPSLAVRISSKMTMGNLNSQLF